MLLAQGRYPCQRGGSKDGITTSHTSRLSLMRDILPHEIMQLSVQLFVCRSSSMLRAFKRNSPAEWPGATLCACIVCLGPSLSHRSS